jgi:MFS family permease
MALTPQRRNVLVLALCQAMTMTSITIMVTVSSLVGQELADDKAFATWPLGLQQIGVMLATFPASLLMRRIGRRAGFTTGAVIGVGGALIQVYVVFHFGFWLFCLGNGLVGVANGFSLFYRSPPPIRPMSPSRARRSRWSWPAVSWRPCWARSWRNGRMIGSRRFSSPAVLWRSQP